jgi:SNF2 family DNA or RNA helicase
MQNNEEFENLIKERMSRYQILLNKAKYDFKQYQYDGVEWCVRNELRPNPPMGYRGGFICDEMGLGKTIQMIATMFVNFLQRTLIVVPPVLIEQWHKSIYDTSGHNAIIYHGLHKNDITIEELSQAHIVVTTYAMLQGKNSLLHKLIWSRIIFDEAHHLRNSNTARYRYCKLIRSRIRWLVTGTPIQNSKQDFYNLCSMVGMKSDFYKNPSSLAIIGKNFILKRTKEQVGIKLPTIFEEVIKIEWENKEEKALAEEIHSLLPGITGVSTEKRKKLAEMFGKGGVLTALIRAKQSCILPNILRKNLVHSEADEEKYLNALKYNSKLDKVIEYVNQNKDNGRGKIIFCHFLEEIDEIVLRLVNCGFANIKTYDGRNSGPKELQHLADPADVLVMQIQTGCEGLNLQENYSEIYFVSPHWNPSIEDQAIGRCHRIGQKRRVDVYKFEMEGFEKDNKENISLETYVAKKQLIKRDISKEIFSKM